MQFRLILTLLMVGCLLLPLGCRKELVTQDHEPPATHQPTDDTRQPAGAVSTTPNAGETPQPAPPLGEDEPAGGGFGGSFESGELGQSPQLELPFPQAHEATPGAAEPLPATRIEPPALTQPPATSGDFAAPPSTFGGLNPPLTTPPDSNSSTPAQPPASRGGFQLRGSAGSSSTQPGGAPALLNEANSSRRTFQNQLEPSRTSSEPTLPAEPILPAEPNSSPELTLPAEPITPITPAEKNPTTPRTPRFNTANSLPQPGIRPATPVQPLEPFGPKADAEGYPLRTWSDRAGQFSLTAKFVGAGDDSGRVRLEQPDGKVFSIDLDELSERDRGYAEAVLNPAALKRLRNWRDSSGRFSLVGKFVVRENEFIRLEDTDGKAFRVTLGSLSSYDRGFIEGLEL